MTQQTARLTIAWTAAVVARGILAPPVVTALAAVLPTALAVLIAAIASAFAVARIATHLDARAAQRQSPRQPWPPPLAHVAWLLVALLAVTQSVRISVYMHDVRREATAALVVLAFVFSTVLVPNIPAHPPLAVVVFSMMRTLLALSINVWVILRRPQSADDGATEGRTSSPHDPADTSPLVG